MKTVSNIWEISSNIYKSTRQNRILFVWPNMETKILEGPKSWEKHFTPIVQKAHDGKSPMLIVNKLRDKLHMIARTHMTILNGDDINKFSKNQKISNNFEKTCNLKFWRIGGGQLIFVTAWWGLENDVGDNEYYYAGNYSPRIPTSDKIDRLESLARITRY